MSSRNPLEKKEQSQLTPGIDKTQKTVAIVLIFAAILIVVFWIIQLRLQLTRPFYVGGEKQTQVDYLDDTQRDTDEDGLSDYDEKNIYQTSPFIQDSDSDGSSDKEEVEKKTDPNCPEGQDCYNKQETEKVDDSISGQIIVPQNLDSSGADSTLLQNALSGGSDANTLRQLLIQSGADEAIIGNISDEDLMKSYQEILNNQNQ